jgi:hypothetical protein
MTMNKTKLIVASLALVSAGAFAETPQEIENKDGCVA